MCKKHGVCVCVCVSVISGITTIFKKEDPYECKNHRPISLPSAPYKLLMSVLNRRLTQGLEVTSTLHPCLFAYGPLRTCMQPVAILNHWSQKAKEQKLQLYTAFIDITSCFDSISHDLLHQAVQAAGLPPAFQNLLSNIYSGASALLVDNGVVDNVRIPFRRGIKQGCPLSPTLFNIFSSIIAHRLQLLGASTCSSTDTWTPEMRSLFYADDIALVSTSATDLQFLLHHLTNICQDLGLSIDPVKSCIVIFHGTDAHRSHIFRANTLVIPVVQEHTYLGCLLNDQFSHHHMMHARIMKAKSILVRSCLFMKRASLCHLQHIKTIYMSTILQTALYGVEV